MSTSLPASPLESPSSEAARVPRRSVSLPDWMREPLLHFVVIGALLFAADQAIAGRAGDPHTIVIGADVDREAVELFEQTRGRKPNRKELQALHQVWLDNEVLYREGLALEVDKGDTAIRERVIFKALSVIDANVKLPPADEKTLRAWFEAHRAKYDEPQRFDFQEAVLGGDNSEGAVRGFVDALNGGTPGDAKAGLRVFKGRPHSNLVQSYGAEFAKTLEESPIGEWRALRTRDGWRAMRLDAALPAKPASFDALQGVILQDWKDATAADQRTAAVRALTRKYKVKYDTTPNPVSSSE